MAKKKAAINEELPESERSSPDGKPSRSSRGKGQQITSKKMLAAKKSAVRHDAPHHLTRGRIEEELIQAKEYAESIVETLHEPLLVLYPDLTVKSCNPAFYEHFHVSPEETRGRRIYALGNGQWDIPELRTLLEDVLPDSKVFNDYEVHHEFEGLGPRVMLLNARRLDHVQLILLGIRDITEKKQAEQKLRESEERYRVFVESVQEYAMLMLDADGRITVWNTGAERIFGHRDSEVLGQDSSITFTEEDRAQGSPEAELATASREGQASNDRWQLRKDGSRFWASGMTEALYDSRGNVRGFAQVLRDNTRQKQDEEALRELNETLERRVVERTAELERQNTRLQLLAQELTQAEHRERRELGQTLHDGLQQVLVAAKMHTIAHNDEAGTLDHIVKLIDDSLNTTRTLSYELNPPKLREAALPSAIQWLASWFAENHGHTVEVAAAPGFPELSEETKVLLYSVARELLLNSVKHSGVKQAEVRLVRGSEGEAVIEVDDEGRGFDPINVQQDSGGHPGFGLFSISERLAALGGRLEIDAAPCAGAHFTVRLPT